MFSKGPRPGFGVHCRTVVSDINGFTDTQFGLMFFCGQDGNVEVTVNFCVGHVFVFLLGVVTEARVGFWGVQNVFVTVCLYVSVR